MDTRQFSLRILEELKQVLDRVDPGAASGLADELLAAERIFLAGAGRSGMAARGFAMRLMHLGLTAYVCGETTAPAIRAKDLRLRRDRQPGRHGAEGPGPGGAGGAGHRPAGQHGGPYGADRASAPRAYPEGGQRISLAPAHGLPF